MAAENRPTSRCVIDELFEHAERFSFFQAVRLMEKVAASGGNERYPFTGLPVGHDHRPDTEAVRFRAEPSHSFPATEVCSLRMPPSENGESPAFGKQRPEMMVAFLGLTGPQGVLPDHYTRLLIQRLRVGDVSMPEFFDLFNHRVISLFYRAWEKHRFFLGYEQASRQSRNHDDFTQALLSLTGFGTEPLTQQLCFHDHALAYYAGHLSHRRPLPVAIEQLLCDYFGVPVEIVQLTGGWLCLSREDQTRLQQGRENSGECHNQLGCGAVVGSRVWDMQFRFVIRIGPLDYAMFRRFTPMGDSLQALSQWVRLKVGIEFDFQMQLVLKADHVPATRLGMHAPDGSRLGWNTWLITRPPTRDAEQAVFAERL